MRFGRLAMVLMVGGVVVLGLACSSGDDSDEPADDDEEATTEATNPPRTRSSSATATPEGKAPRFTPGKWTAGEAEARVTGGTTFTVKGTLNNQASSDKDTTRLIFVAGTDTITMSISNIYQPFGMTVYKEPIDIQSNSDTPCEVSYSETSDKRIAGSFKCIKVKVAARNAVTGDTMVEGTFSATR